MRKVESSRSRIKFRDGHIIFGRVYWSLVTEPAYPEDCHYDVRVTPRFRETISNGWYANLVSIDVVRSGRSFKFRIGLASRKKKL